MTHTLTVPRSLKHIVETECSPRVVAMSSYLYIVFYLYICSFNFLNIPAKYAYLT